MSLYHIINGTCLFVSTDFDSITNYIDLYHEMSIIYKYVYIWIFACVCVCVCVLCVCAYCLSLAKRHIHNYYNIYTYLV